MAAPAIPSNFTVQQGNGQVLLMWNLAPGATSYVIQRSADNITYSTIATVAVNQYVDASVTINTQYWYKVASSNGTLSSYTEVAAAIPTLSGTDSLASVRLQAKQRADRVNSNFVTDSEWNNNINQSYFELYDILTTTYENYYRKPAPYTFNTDGTNNTFSLPTDFYKANGLDLGLDASNNAWVTLHRFNYIDRNAYVYPTVAGAAFGIYNPRYDIFGSPAKVVFIPTPSANQVMRLWYTPKLQRCLLDTDILDGVNGWLEYVIVDAAIKALQKEESDCTLLMVQKQALLHRIEAAAQNRDAGEPMTISATRRTSSGNYGGSGWDGGYGGY